MTIARRLESRLCYLNLFVTFSLLSTLTCMILETIIYHVSWDTLYVDKVLGLSVYSGEVAQLHIHLASP